MRAKTQYLMSSFSLSRFTMLYDAFLSYSFEIQIVPGYQRRGIGAYLIGLLETIGRAMQMEKVMLTVFKGKLH